jgi:hypothetical protein
MFRLMLYNLDADMAQGIYIHDVSSLSGEGPCWNRRTILRSLLTTGLKLHIVPYFATYVESNELLLLIIAQYWYYCLPIFVTIII